MRDAIEHDLRDRALAGEVYAPVGFATHYHTTWVNPYWAPSLAHIGTIGAHRFYRWPGAASRPEAFSDVYRGGEPLPQPAIAARSAEPAPDPVAIARQYEVADRGTTTPGLNGDNAWQAESVQPRSQPVRPQPTEAQEGSGSVRPEYANSGRWIGQPN